MKSNDIFSMRIEVFNAINNAWNYDIESDEIFSPLIILASIIPHRNKNYS